MPNAGDSQVTALARTRVNEIAKSYALSKDDAFLVWAANLIWALPEDEAVEFILDRPNDKSVDFFWYDDAGDRIIIAQAKFTSSPKVRDLVAFPGCLNWISKPEALQQEGLSDLADAALQFVELRQRDVPVELWFIHFGDNIRNLEKEAEVFNSNDRNRLDRLTVHIGSRVLLEGLLADLEDAESRVQGDRLKVSWAQPQAGPYGEALVATVPGSELARLYDTHQNRLFARNVRLFLGERKGSVNKGIVDTLEDRDDRGNFWAYNNGVTIVCQVYEYRPRKRELELRNFSSVNGCQTTVCLHKAKGPLTSDVEVLVKILGPPASVIDRIIEFTNSQSPIRSWDIKSQDKVQRRLREELRSLSVPFFYAIRKGEFESLSRAQKRQFRERGQKHVVEFDTVAQYLGAFRGRSYFAYKFKTRLFEDLYRDVFPESMTSETVLFAWQLGELGRQVVKTSIAEVAGDDDQKETLRILRKGCRVYLIAVAEYLLRRRNGETYLTKLADGKPWGSLRKDRMTKYCDWALDLYVEATHRFLEDGKTDLNTLLRQEDFIKRVLRHVEQEYRRYSRNKAFFDGALPRAV